MWRNLQILQDQVKNPKIVAMKLVSHKRGVVLKKLCLWRCLKARTDNSNKHVGVLNLKLKRKVDEFFSKHLKNCSTIINFFFICRAWCRKSGFRIRTYEWKWSCDEPEGCARWRNDLSYTNVIQMLCKKLTCLSCFNPLAINWLL